LKIGVVIPAYNAASCIGVAIASVIAQSHTDWAMLVVDDGSIDGTADVVAGFSDARIRLIGQANAGVSAARNRGAREVDGDAVLFLDADDFLAPDALARLAVALESSPRAVASYGGYGFVTADATPGARAFGLKSFREGTGDLFEALLERNLFANGGHVLIRRTALDAMNGFRTDIVFGEDWEFWVRLAMRGPFAAVPGRSPLLFVRQLPSGAYLRMATDPHAFGPCMEAIFGNALMRSRLGTARRFALRQRAEAENAWIIGRELIRHGNWDEGRRWLLHSLSMKPRLKRSLMLAATPVLALLPGAMRGPFRPYPGGSGRDRLGADVLDIPKS
jgi:glycosyltransferase involved in cell wall biosynthesis